jgi:type II secretory pathway component GspD/PulD (secretin)
LAGDQSIVAQALDLAKKLDVRRAQVKIGVQITDIDRSALKDLGLQYTFGSFGLQESQPSGIGFGKFTRSPLSVSATISALETSGDAKLLAAPNMTLLDGEQGYILIGDRLQFPQLIGYTPAQTPIYNVTEERVGIYLQLAVHMEDNGEITLTIYPQVSTVTGYLNINGASYPQISTREQQTTVRVKDGQQIVVGGLIQDEEIKNIQKVPILSDIPILRELFTYRDTTKQQTEVVILITPQILKG